MYYPDGRTECHEMCFGCRANGSCPFHPQDYRCNDRGEWGPSNRCVDVETLDMIADYPKRRTKKRIEILPASTFKTGISVHGGM